MLIFFSHVPELEDEAAEDAAERGQEVGRGEAEDEAGELAVTEPGTTHDHAIVPHYVFTTYRVLLKRMTGAAARLVTSASPSSRERARMF